MLNESNEFSLDAPAVKPVVRRPLAERIAHPLWVK